MGVHLEIVSDHKFEYDFYDKMSTGEKVLLFLNQLTIPNQDFVKKFHRLWEGLPEDAVLENFGWRYYYDKEFDETESEDGGIVFFGPYGLEFTLLKNMVQHFNFSVNYWNWYLPKNEKEFIEPWRIYFQEITRLFGGNKIIYFHDTMPEIDLIWNSATTIDSLEQKLKKNQVQIKNKYTEETNYFTFDFYVEEIN